MAEYVFKRGDVFYYRRRVPEYIREYERRDFVKISLGTSDEKEAHRKASLYNEYIEDFWRTLIKAGGSEDTHAQYRATVRLAKAHGFAYKSVAEIAKAPLTEIVSRVKASSSAIDTPQVIAAVLGAAERPVLRLSECIENFWPLASDRITNKSDHQIRKWKNPRIAAMKYLIEAVGNKELADFSRRDALQFRQWLMERLSKGEIIAATANRALIQSRDIMKIVAQHCEIETDFDVLFTKIKFKETDNARPPYEAEYVQNTLLDPVCLKGLNKEARMLIYAMADTGARESELIGLQAEDILLDADVPHIWIRPRQGHALKTATSERKIPLVGASLYAFQQLPKGFTHYRSADAASATINKYFRENGLKPSPKHSLYSLRHTFKDRLRDAEAPEEIIDELMGHKKSGPKYGRGHMLERKHEWLQKIAFSVQV